MPHSRSSSKDNWDKLDFNMQKALKMSNEKQKPK